MDIELKKPVKLELNNSGAWKTLARFDADDREACDKALTAGMHLGAIDQRVKLRIATADGLERVLMRWTPERGWRDEFSLPMPVGEARESTMREFEATR